MTRDGDKLTTMHNEMAPDIVRAIVIPTLKAGGSPQDVLVLLESIVMGVVLCATTPDKHIEAVDLIAAAVKRRIAEQALAEIPAAGCA